jgi:hypothetical protein
LALTRERPYCYVATVPAQWITPGRLTYRLILEGDGGALHPQVHGANLTPEGAWQVPIVTRDAPVLLFDAKRHPVRAHGSVPLRQRLVPGTTPNTRVLQIAVDAFGPPPSSVSFQNELLEELDLRRDDLKARTTLRIRARALEPSTDRVEVVLIEHDGTPWGANIPLGTQWQDIRVPLSSLRFYKHWGNHPADRAASDRIRPEALSAVNVCFGAWLYPAHAAQRHTVEIEQIVVR